MADFTRKDAVRIDAKSLLHQKTDNILELGYHDKKRIHNLKYCTWIEQQGKKAEELNAQWYDRDYWTTIQSLVLTIDRQITDFNAEVGLQ